MYPVALRQEMVQEQQVDSRRDLTLSKASSTNRVGGAYRDNPQSNHHESFSSFGFRNPAGCGYRTSRTFPFLSRRIPTRQCYSSRRMRGKVVLCGWLLAVLGKYCKPCLNSGHPGPLLSSSLPMSLFQQRRHQLCDRPVYYHRLPPATAQTYDKGGMFESLRLLVKSSCRYVGAAAAAPCAASLCVRSEHVDRVHFFPSTILPASPGPRTVQSRQNGFGWPPHAPRTLNRDQRARGCTSAKRPLSPRSRSIPRESGDSLTQGLLEIVPLLLISTCSKPHELASAIFFPCLTRGPRRSKRMKEGSREGHDRPRPS